MTSTYDAILLDIGNGPDGLTRKENDRIDLPRGLLVFRATHFSSGEAPSRSGRSRLGLKTVARSSVRFKGGDARRVGDRDGVGFFGTTDLGEWSSSSASTRWPS